MATRNLHEIIAVEGDLKKTADNILAEAEKTLGRHELFHGMTRVFTSLQEKEDGSTDPVEPPETKTVATTVTDKLDYVWNTVSKYLDVFLTKEKGNQSAKGDVVIDGTVLLKDVPVGALVGLEGKLKSYRRVLEAIPTTDVTKTWEKSKDLNLWVTVDRPVIRTKKEKKHKVMVPDSPHHPAQVTQWDEDVPVARVTTTHFSGALSPMEKSILLNRLDILTQAVKQARSRANQEKIEQQNIMSRLFDFLKSGTLPS